MNDYDFRRHDEIRSKRLMYIDNTLFMIGFIGLIILALIL